jgi:hypothetical protein
MAGEFSLLDNGANYDATSGLLVQNPDTPSALWWNGTTFVAIGSLTAGEIAGAALIAGYKETISGGSWDGWWKFDLPGGADVTQVYRLDIYGTAAPVLGSIVALSYSKPSPLTVYTVCDSTGTPVTMSELLHMLVAFCASPTIIVTTTGPNKTVSFKKQDGTTTSFSVTFPAATGARTASTIHS